jgi:subtilisin family serine protease
LYFKPRRRHILLLIGVLFGVVSLSGVDVRPDLRKIEPVMLATDEPAIVAAQGKVMSATGRLPPLPRVFVHLREEEQAFPGKIEALGGTASPIHPRLFSGAIPRDAARYISRWPEVAYIEAEKLARPMLDESRPAVSADIVHAGTGLPASYTGTGTFVGIVDTGISGSHPDFTGRIDFGTSFSPSFNPLEDTDGHGTHVAGIASGDGLSSSGLFSGMAPESSLLIGRAGLSSFGTDDIIRVVNEMVSFAGTTPVAINLSLGLTTGPHDGTSGFESAIDFLATGPPGSKRLLVAAAGNERTNEEHFQAVLPPFGLTKATVTFDGLSSTPVEIWADGDDLYTVTATMGTETVTVAPGSSGSSAGRRITVSNAVSLPPNGATFISVVFLPVKAGETATIQLGRTRNGGTGMIDGYIDLFNGIFSAISEAGTISKAGTITEPANAENVIAVGSFNTKRFPSGLPDPTEEISTFSSLGPTRDGRIKPDITAPGFVIYSTRSLEAPEANYSFGVIDNNYAIDAGTSMSAPHVAGIAALVWQSNPVLTGAQMWERLRRTAAAPTDGSAVPNNTWGYGKVNALRAVAEPVAAITAPATTTPDTPVILTSENSSGPLGATITNYQWSAPGASVTPSDGGGATFLANTPDDYTVSLVVTSGGTASLPYTKTIHVNQIPTALVNGPSTDNVGIPVSFSGVGSDDPDGQKLTYRWVLVSRPAGSNASLPASNVPDVSFTPDATGTYVVGLRVDDGLDNSSLVTKSYTAVNGAATGSGGGGGGGCAYVNGKGEDDAASIVPTLLLLLSPLGVLCAGKRGYRFPRPCLRRSSPRR